MVVPVNIKYSILIVLFVLGSINFTRTAIEILDNSKRFDSLGDEVSALRQQKADLEQNIAYKKTGEYVEEKARNDLNMIRPGEKVYVFPKTANNSDSEMIKTEEKRVLTKRVNLNAWIALFLRFD